MIIIGPICRFLLYALGWQSPNYSVLYESSHKEVAIYLHTSTVDFWIVLLYMLAYDNIRRILYVYMKPQPFSIPIIGRLLHFLHFIPASRREDRGTGATQQVINYLSTKQPFIFLISPKGTVQFAEWRTGWYHIAKGLSADVGIFTLDYADHRIHHYTIPTSDKESMENILRAHLRRTVPLYPLRSEVNILRQDIPSICASAYNLYMAFFAIGVAWQILGSIPIALLLLETPIFNVIWGYCYYYICLQWSVSTVGFIASYGSYYILPVLSNLLRQMVGL